MKRLIITGSLIFAGLAAGAATAKSTTADPKSLAFNQCFRVSDVQNSVQVSETRLNILTKDHRYIRVDMSGRCFYPPFTDPYVVQSHGDDIVCSPVDLDIAAGPPGFKTPCIVDRITQMTPAEVAAMPKKEKP
ncbi:MAG TPA: hypothetical protein VMU59_04500 [Caulobacteraceae bacterium]|nr:hypothetical protein [Caulobacteraceae bacterium]